MTGMHAALPGCLADAGASVGHISLSTKQIAGVHITTINKPTGVVSGNKLLLLAGTNDNIGDGGAEWDATGADFPETRDSGGIWVGSKTAGAFEGSSYSMEKRAGTNDIAAYLLNFGPNTVFTVGTVLGVEDDPPEAPGITMPDAGTLLAFFITDGGEAFTPPSGMELVTAALTATDVHAYLFRQNVAAGATGVRTAGAPGGSTPAATGVLIGVTKA